MIGDGDLGLFEGLEALLSNLENVDARRQIAEGESTALVADELARQTGALVGDDDSGSWDERARGVLDVTEDRSVEHLREALPRNGKRHNQDRQEQTRQ